MSGGVALRPTTEEDLPDLVRLWNDGRVMARVGCPHGLGMDLAAGEAGPAIMGSAPAAG